jgi:hypothetical protein
MIRALKSAVGRTGRIQVSAMAVRVRVIDTRRAYGRFECLVEPVAGEGRAWMTADKVALDPVPAAGIVSTAN